MNSGMDPKESDQPPSTGFSFTGLVNLPGQDPSDGALVCGPGGCLPPTYPAAGGASGSGE